MKTMKIEMGKKYAFRGGPRYGTYELLRTDLGGLVPVLGIRTETNGGKCALFHTFEGKVVLTNSNSQSRHPLDLIEVTPYSHIHTELSKVEKQRDMLLEVLRRISSPTQTENLTWWQNEAREAIAAVEVGE